MKPQDYWIEAPKQRSERVAQQEANRASCTDDHMELIYSTDLDEVFAELLRLHQTSRAARTEELLRRVFPERMEEAGL